MYGLVNQTIKSMVVETSNPAIWGEICKKLNISAEDFDSFVQYPDDLTLNLVITISEKLQVEIPILLEEFGKYFVKYAQQSEYQSILQAFGKTPVELIESLDSLHARLGLLFDNLKPPSFWVEKKSSNELLVFYSSQRNMPLDHFVVGLLKGIFAMFNQKCEVSIIPKIGNETALFKVNY